MWRIIAILIVCLLLTPAALLNAESNTTVASEEAKRAYADAIMLHLKNNWGYQTSPEKFKDYVLVKLKIDREGKVLEKTITKNAQDNRLDEEALKQLAGMEPFPKMPVLFHKDTGYVQFQHQFKPTSIITSLKDAQEFVKEPKD